MLRYAKFSKNKKFRYKLLRIWDVTKPGLVFIGLNPSIANETDDDPTIRKVVGFAERLGCGGITMLNCFPYISTDSSKLKHYPIAEIKNLGIIREYSKPRKVDISYVVFGWGNHELVEKLGYEKILRELFPNAYCLIKNKNGTPRHPLYVPYSCELIKF